MRKGVKRELFASPLCLYLKRIAVGNCVSIKQDSGALKICIYTSSSHRKTLDTIQINANLIKLTMPTAQVSSSWHALTLWKSLK